MTLRRGPHKAALQPRGQAKREEGIRRFLIALVCHGHEYVTCGLSKGSLEGRWAEKGVPVGPWRALCCQSVQGV